jgi:hypothetical protein
LQLGFLFPGLHKERQSYRRSLQLSKQNIQHFKKLNLLTFFDFCSTFLPSWILIRIANRDPDTDSGTPLNSVPDPQNRFFLAKFNFMGDFLQVKSSHESAAERLKKRISRLEEVRNQLIKLKFSHFDTFLYLLYVLYRKLLAPRNGRWAEKWLALSGNYHDYGW